MQLEHEFNMDSDPWRNPFVEETQPKASTSSHASTSLRWTPAEDDGLEDVSVTAPGHGAAASWDPVGDEGDSVWTWQGPSKPQPAAPEWGAPTPETRSWSPPPIASAYAFPKLDDPPTEDIVTEPTPPRTPIYDLPATDISSPWSGNRDDIPPIITDPEPSSPSPPRSPPPQKSPSPIPASPDGFGSFEVAPNGMEVPASAALSTSWSHTGADAVHSFDAEPSWGSAVSEQPIENAAHKDEWEAASAAREQRDRIVVRAYRYQHALFNDSHDSTSPLI